MIGMIGRKTYFKLHQTIGVGIAVLLLLSALTGMLLVFRGSFGKQPPPRAPVVETPLALEVLIARAVAAGPGDPVTDIGLPMAPDQPYLFYLDDDDETIVYLAGDGAVLAVHTTAQGFTRTLFRLHTGEIAGTPGEALNFVAGTGLVVLVVSGLMMIVSRRRARRA